MQQVDKKKAGKGKGDERPTKPPFSEGGCCTLMCFYRRSEVSGGGGVQFARLPKLRGSSMHAQGMAKVGACGA